MGRARKMFHFGRPFASSSFSCFSFASFAFFSAAIFDLRDVGVEVGMGLGSAGGVGGWVLVEDQGADSGATRLGKVGVGWEVRNIMQVGARARSRVSVRASCKVRLEEGQRSG